MSQLAISTATSAAFNDFQHTADCIVNEIQTFEKSLTEDPKFEKNLDECTKVVNDAYTRIEWLRIQRELLLAQVQKVTLDPQTVERITSDTEGKIAKVTECVKAAHAKWIEGALIPYSLQSRVLRLMADSHKLRSFMMNPMLQSGLISKMKKDWVAISGEISKLCNLVKEQQLPLSPSSGLALDILPGTLLLIKEQLIQLDVYYEEPIIRLIDLILHPTAEDCNQQIDRLLDKMDPKFQELFDYFVYLFSPDPKGGHEWGKLHRYDRGDVLQKALCVAIWDHIKQRMPSVVEVKEKDIKRVLLDRCSRLMQPALHKEKDRLMDQYKTGRIRKPKETLIHPPRKTEKAEKFTEEEIVLRPAELCRTLYIEGSPDEFQTIFYGSPRPMPQPFWSLDENQVKTKTERSELEKVRDKLRVVCEQHHVDLEVRQQYIQGCLDALPLSEQWLIEGFVYTYSEDPWKGGEYWGHHHAYDNPQVLLQAVEHVLTLQSSDS